MIDERRHHHKSKYEMFHDLNIHRSSLTCTKCKWVIHEEIEIHVQAGGHHYHDICYKK